MTIEATETLFEAIAPIGPTQWMDDAACRAHPPDWWHPHGHDARQQTEEARRVCAGCPVRSDCLEYALGLLARTGQVHGVWGGLTARQVRNLAARQARPVRPVAQHGTRSRYVLGCRCDPCRRANTAYKAARPSPARERWQVIVDAGRAQCTADRCLEPDAWIRPGSDWSVVRTRDGTPGLMHRRCHRSFAVRQRWSA